MSRSWNRYPRDCSLPFFGSEVGRSAPATASFDLSVLRFSATSDTRQHRSDKSQRVVNKMEDEESPNAQTQHENSERSAPLLIFAPALLAYAEQTNRITWSDRLNSHD